MCICGWADGVFALCHLLRTGSEGLCHGRQHGAGLVVGVDECDDRKDRRQQAKGRNELRLIILPFAFCLLPSVHSPDVGHALLHCARFGHAIAVVVFDAPAANDAGCAWQAWAASSGVCAGWHLVVAGVARHCGGFVWDEQRYVCTLVASIAAIDLWRDEHKPPCQRAE